MWISSPPSTFTSTPAESLTILRGLVLPMALSQGSRKLAILTRFQPRSAREERYSRRRHDRLRSGGTLNFISRFAIVLGLGLTSQAPIAEVWERLPMPALVGKLSASRHLSAFHSLPHHSLPNVVRSSDHGTRRSGSGRPAVDLSHTLWARVASARSLDPYLLYAVALIESARISGGLAAPWPWALNHSGRTFYPENPETALAQIRNRLDVGQNVIDIGLMQVNLRWHGRRVRTLEALLDPVTNVQLGAEILAETIASAPGDLALGVGRYHTWRNLKAAYRYGRKVLALAERLRSSRLW